MNSAYTQQVIKVIVAQVCQTIGWNSIQSTPLELLGDILHKYLEEIAHQTHRYSELCKCSCFCWLTTLFLRLTDWAFHI